MKTTITGGSTKSRPYVYMCTHATTGEFYFGYREKNLKLGLPSDVDFPKYQTSSKRVKPRFNEFEWKILAEFETGDDAYDFEQELINEHWDNPLLLNGAKNQRGNKRFKNNIVTEETKRKISIANTGRKHSAKTKEKLSMDTKGKPKSEETKRKMCKPKSPEHAAKNRVANLGRTASAETKSLMSFSKQQRSDAEKKLTFDKMSANRKGKVSAYDFLNNIIVRVDKFEFDKLKNTRYVGIKSKIAMEARHGR